jgi:hypothetical protein
MLLAIVCAMECRGLCPLPGLCHSLRLLVYENGGEERDGE